MTLRKTSTAALALVATLAVLVTGCGSDSDSGSTASKPAATTGADAPASGALTPVKNGVVEVAFRDFAIDPEEIVVKSGQEIKWTNFDSTKHNVVIKPEQPEAFTSKDFEKDGTATYSPKKPGVYEYLCTYHAGSMQGKITVQG